MEKCLRSPVPLLAMLCVLLLIDGTGMIRLSILASILHELGHCAVYCIQTRKLPRLQFDLCGIGLRVQSLHQSRLRQTLLLAAGPLANLIMCGLLLWMIQQKATYARYFFLAANLICAGYNLLPIGILDGAGLLRLWLSVKFEKYEFLLERTATALLIAGVVYSLFGKMQLWAAVAFFVVFGVSLWQGVVQR